MAAIKGEKTLSELAEQFDVHANQITHWKSQLLDGAVDVFGGEAKADPAAAAVDLKTLSLTWAYTSSILAALRSAGN